MIDAFFKYNNQIAVIFFVASFLALWIKHSLEKSALRLEALLNNALASATIPTGIALIFCAIDPTYVSRLEGLNINLSVAGIVLVFIAIRAVQTGWKAKTIS